MAGAWQNRAPAAPRNASACGVGSALEQGPDIPVGVCGILDFNDLDAAEGRTAENHPWFRRRLRDIALGSEVQVRTDAALVLSSCRAESIPTTHDSLRIASLGLTARVLQKDLGDNTVLCSVPGVGDVWFPLPALTWTQKAAPLRDAGTPSPAMPRTHAVPGSRENGRLHVRRFHTVGDSHSVNGWPPDVCTHFVGSILSYNVSRVDVRRLDPPIEEGDAVCFSFGEIDCRCHVHKHCQEGRAYQDVIDEIIARYLGYLCEQAGLLPADVRIFVYNVLPPVKMKNMQHNSDRPMNPFIVPFAGSDQERLEYVRYFNRSLEAECTAHGFAFLDVVDLYAMEDGFLDPDLSDSSIHIGDGRLLRQFLERMVVIRRPPPPLPAA